MVGEGDEISFRPGKSSLNPKLRLRRRAVGAHAILDGDAAGLIFAQWCVNDPLLRHDMAVGDGEVFFFNGPVFKKFPQFASDDGIFCDDDDPAGFPVEPVDEVGL